MRGGPLPVAGPAPVVGLPAPLVAALGVLHSLAVCCTAGPALGAAGLPAPALGALLKAGVAGLLPAAAGASLPLDGLGFGKGTRRVGKGVG